VDDRQALIQFGGFDSELVRNDGFGQPEQIMILDMLKGTADNDDWA
jgi:hypothetical protein